MDQNVLKLMDWLTAQAGETIMIKKQEMNDLDTVHFNLETVDYRNTEDVIDEYLDSALILRGTGNTLNRDGELVPLPQQNYEIAVSGLQLDNADDGQVELRTERAKYSISKA
ncbi:hypothetical protein [Paenibacillus riograndensis]|uniref:Uncharacterized protein n=1 Tax=Paenibacillus riograndensis SBR5 TaxID=1073571 RepID=A0A0E4CX92_9BACL|nr:hypothetical protein [Paenibacillus riograndensis]KWX84062.1 hypothetical protein AMQ83_29910 [Paenibacillus riograndensis]CQR56117.1 hypothetical protein PRIO_3714 [Paenibacillus riograndensis SBR5]